MLYDHRNIEGYLDIPLKSVSLLLKIYCVGHVSALKNRQGWGCLSGQSMTSHFESLQIFLE